MIRELYVGDQVTHIVKDNSKIIRVILAFICLMITTDPCYELSIYTIQSF